MLDRVKNLARRLFDAVFEEPDPLWSAYVNAATRERTTLTAELAGAQQAEAAMRMERDKLREDLAEAKATSEIHVAAVDRARTERDKLKAAAIKAHAYCGCLEEPGSAPEICFICAALTGKAAP